jgi:hypothetical protein
MQFQVVVLAYMWNRNESGRLPDGSVDMHNKKT